MAKIMFIDTHSHLNFPQFKDDLEQVIQRAKKARVDRIIIVGSNSENSSLAISLSQKYNNLLATFGLHPSEVDLHWSKIMARFKKEVDPESIVAIGEIGLDYYSKDKLIKKEVQLEALEVFVELANRLNLPLIFHCREAMDDFIEVLIRKKPEKGVLHCFPGNKEEAKKILDLGLLISFTGLITFVSDFDEVIKYTPLDKIMLETDCPYLAPEPHRGKRNEPAYVVEIARRIAEIKDISFYKVAEETTKNATRLFALDKF